MSWRIEKEEPRKTFVGIPFSVGASQSHRFVYQAIEEMRILRIIALPAKDSLILTSIVIGRAYQFHPVIGGGIPLSLFCPTEDQLLPVDFDLVHVGENLEFTIDNTSLDDFRGFLVLWYEIPLYRGDGVRNR